MITPQRDAAQKIAKSPSRQIGVIRDENSEGHLKTFPVPEAGPNEVLTENVAVASNPKDWKYPQWSNDYSYVGGNDVAGTIVGVGDAWLRLRGCLQSRVRYGIFLHSLVSG